MCAPVSIHVYTQVMHLLSIAGFILGPVTFPFKKAHYFFDPAIERRKPGAWPHVAESQNSIPLGKSGVIPRSTMAFPRTWSVKVKKELSHLILLPTSKIVFTAVPCTHSFHRVINWHQGLKPFALQDVGELHVDWQHGPRVLHYPVLIHVWCVVIAGSAGGKKWIWKVVQHDRHQREVGPPPTQKQSTNC